MVMFTAGIHEHYHESSDCFEYPKKSLLKSNRPRKYLPDFPSQKNPGIENFKSPKHPSIIPSLEIRSTHLGPVHQKTHAFLKPLLGCYEGTKSQTENRNKGLKHKGNKL